MMYKLSTALASASCLLLSRFIVHARIHSVKNGNHTYIYDSDYTKEYVGLGYDAVFGNPVGGTSTNVDSGYRNAIIDTSAPNGDDASKASPSGSIWTREFSTCWHSDEHENKRDDELAKELTNEFQIEGSETNELLNANVRNSLNPEDSVVTSAKYLLTNSFCVIRESGLILPFKGKLTEFFEKDLEAVPKDITGMNKCTPDVYITQPTVPECKDINLWIRFFRRYGTHITTHIVTGGHIRYVDKMASVNNAVKKKAKSGQNEPLSTKETFERSLRGAKESRQMWIIGGYYVKGLESNNFKAFKKWFHNISKRPMPIRGNFASLEHFVGDKANAYHKALNFYRNFQKVANGHSLSYLTFIQMVKETATVASNDAIVHCPDNLVVVAGFVISKSSPTRIDSCIAASNAVALAFCAKGGSFKMKAFASNKRSSCPAGLVIAIGFQLYKDITSSLQLASCPAGEKNCGDIPGTEGVEWKICVPRNILDPLMVTTTGEQKGDGSKKINCPKGQKIRSGFYLLKKSGSLTIGTCLPFLERCYLRCRSHNCEEAVSYQICS